MFFTSNNGLQVVQISSNTGTQVWNRAKDRRKLTLTHVSRSSGGVILVDEPKEKVFQPSSTPGVYRSRGGIILLDRPKETVVELPSPTDKHVKEQVELATQPALTRKDPLSRRYAKENEKSRVIVVTSGKGGVGKTSITANIGTSIARLGYKTVLIDADIGLKNLDLLVGLENRIMYTVMDVFEGRCRLDQALTRDKRWKNLSLLSISKNRQRYNITRKNMHNIVQALVNLDYSYILIDCPAGIDVGFINAVSPANEAIIVTTPELPALRDADRVAGLLEANGIYDIKLLVNRVRPDLVSSHNMLSVKDVQEALGIPLLGAVPEDLEIILSTNFGEPLVLRRKLTLAGIALETIARRLAGYKTDFLNLETPYKNLFQKAVSFFARPFQ